MTRARLGLAVIIVLAVGVAWLVRFGCDDAYISFVYARNLVRGDGLTWFGTRIEGYTNFAWVLWAAAGIRAGVDPLVWAWIGSLSALAAALAATWGLVRVRGGSPVAAACAIGILATNFTFVAFGTSGLETMLQTALLAAAMWLAELVRRDRPTPRRLVLLSFACAFALWTRLDSALAIAVVGVAVAYRLVRARAGMRLWLAALAPAVVLVGGWLAWKLAYYGMLLPNTFYAKTTLRAGTLAVGASFLGAFLHTYMLWPLLLVAVATAIVKRRFTAWMLAAVVALQFAYIVVVGGDFMEFRFFVPILPALAAIIAESVTTQATSPRVPAAAMRAVLTVSVLAAFSWRHAAAFTGFASDASYDSVHQLAVFYGLVPDGAWQRTGLAIRRGLVGSSATLACNGAGAIPYFADLPTVDQLGLNDAWVARNGAGSPTNARPGHQRFATYEYLVDRKVTFVIGSPTVIATGSLATTISPAKASEWLWSFLGLAPRSSVRSLELVAVPLTRRDSLLMWYLTPSPEIDARIAAAGWERGRIDLPAEPVTPSR